MSTYLDLDVWHEARALARDVYQITARFPRSEMFGLTQQLRRAAVSVVSNIAEGQGRWSHPEQVRFYFVARGSLLEVETQLYLSMDLEYIDPTTLDQKLARTRKIGRMLNGLIRRANAKQPEARGPRPDSSELMPALLALPLRHERPEQE
ncbi:MAG TPA: four helix bundle protein [Thermoanaerobaculia bacterium]|nr:four helix bundle protein [Thermoanaerobaculia bacterium]